MRIDWEDTYGNNNGNGSWVARGDDRCGPAVGLNRDGGVAAPLQVLHEGPLRRGPERLRPTDRTVRFDCASHTLDTWDLKRWLLKRSLLLRQVHVRSGGGAFQGEKPSSAIVTRKKIGYIPLQNLDFVTCKKNQNVNFSPGTGGEKNPGSDPTLRG